MDFIASLLSINWSTVNWGDVATWFQGIVTLALFIVAFIQIRTEREYRLRREAAEEGKALRSQAELISAWIVAEGMAQGTRDGEPTGGPVAWVAVSNQSAQPVYQVIVSLYAISQTGDTLRGEMPAGRACIDVVPPGTGYVQVGAAYQGMFRRPGIEIGFQDHFGQAWARRPWGELIELDRPTTAYYRVGLPTSWTGLAQEVPPEDEWDPFSGVITREEWEAMRQLYSESPQRPAKSGP